MGYLALPYAQDYNFSDGERIGLSNPNKINLRTSQEFQVHGFTTRSYIKKSTHVNIDQIRCKDTRYALVRFR